MSPKSVAAKARVKPGTTVAVLNSVPAVVESLGLPSDVVFVTPGKAQLVFLFVNTRAELESRMPRAFAALSDRRSLGVLSEGREGRKARHESQRRLGDGGEVGHEALGSRERRRDLVGVSTQTGEVERQVPPRSRPDE